MDDQRFPRPAILIAALALAAVGCSTASPSAPIPPATTASPPASTAAPPKSAAPTVSSSPSAAPSSTASLAPSPNASLPSGWTSCSNSHVGFEIGYPAAWYTAELNLRQVCQQFDPMEFTIPVDGEYPLTALNAVQTPDLFDPATSGQADPTARMLLREATIVGGRAAVRFEWSLSEAGMLPIDTKRYGYVIDRDGREFTVFTTAIPAQAGYEDWKPVVDQAVETLRLH